MKTIYINGTEMGDDIRYTALQHGPWDPSAVHKFGRVNGYVDSFEVRYNAWRLAERAGVHKTANIASMRITLHYTGALNTPVSMYIEPGHTCIGAVELNGNSFTFGGIVSQQLTDPIMVFVPGSGETGTVEITGYTIEIECYADRLEIENAPTQTTDTGEIDYTGMRVYAVYGNNVRKELGNADQSSLPDKYSIIKGELTEGKYSVTIEYTEDGRKISKSFDVFWNIYLENKKDISYGAGTSFNKMDIKFPDRMVNKRYPAVITLHGGAWCAGKKEDFEFMSRDITENGMIHVSLDYRLTAFPKQYDNDPDVDTGYIYTDMINDIASAISYLYQNAEKYHIDTSEIALWGYSAGAHLGLLYAYKSTCTDLQINPDKIVSPIPVKLVIGMGTPVDFNAGIDAILKYNTEMIGRIEKLTGNGYDPKEGAHETAWKKASPVYYADEHIPKTFFINGNFNNGYFRGDGIVPIEPIEQLYAGHLQKIILFAFENINHVGYRSEYERENGELRKAILSVLSKFRERKI